MLRDWHKIQMGKSPAIEAEVGRVETLQMELQSRGYEFSLTHTLKWAIRL